MITKTFAIRISIFVISLAMISYIMTEKPVDYIILVFLLVINIMIFLLPSGAEKKGAAKGAARENPSNDKL